MARNLREIVVETYLRNRVREVGGLCYKWVCPGHSGVPDRLVFYNGMVYVVETKAKYGKLSPIQVYVRHKLEKQKANYYVCHTKEQVDKFIEEITCNDH